MSKHAVEPVQKRGWIVPMRPRSPHEPHRPSTPLELFFDLVFVVAVAQAANRLHHGIAEGHTSEALLSFTLVFFAIWWAWMNFTWFASAYDTDDVPYRLAVFVQLTGALIMAAGIPQAFDAQDWTIAVIGYVVMRLALVVQWLRAAQADPERRPCAYRYAIGITLCQIGWIVRLLLSLSLISFFILGLVELLVPVWAERYAPTTWHRGHITERYGLFTIIVLGESILSASLAIQSIIQAGEFSSELVEIIMGGLLIVLTMWWFYFDQPTHDLLNTLRTAIFWGYGHLFIFAAAAAVGAGIAVVVDQATHHAQISAQGAGFAVTLPVAVYLMGLWAIHTRPRVNTWFQILLFPVMTLLILLTPFTGKAVLMTGLLLAALLTIKLISRYQGSYTQ